MTPAWREAAMAFSLILACASALGLVLLMAIALAGGGERVLAAWFAGYWAVAIAGGVAAWCWAKGLYDTKEDSR